jgi:hypothetical protein
VVTAAKRAHERALKKKFLGSFFRINNGWHLFGVVFSIVVALAATFAQTADGFDALWFFATAGGQATLAAVAIGFVANGVFGRLLKAPTIGGRRLMDEIEGFRQYLDVAEGDEIKLAGAPRKTPGLFEAYLPFALALGIEQKWAESFAAVFATQAPKHTPDWYRGERWSVREFSVSFGRSFDAAIASASTAPGSSSGGGRRRILGRRWRGRRRWRLVAASCSGADSRPVAWFGLVVVPPCDSARRERVDLTLRFGSGQEAECGVCGLPFR